MASTNSISTQSTSNRNNSFMVERPSEVLRYLKATNDLDSWISELHRYLSEDGIPYDFCEDIACHRLSNIFNKICNRSYDMSDAFPLIEGKIHAENLFKADIRHLHTNYDSWCELNSSQIKNLSKRQLHERWKTECPEDNAKYEELIRILYNKHIIFDKDKYSIPVPSNIKCTTMNKPTVNAPVPTITEPVVDEPSPKDMLREKLNMMIATSVVLIKYKNNKKKIEMAKATTCPCEIPNREIGGCQTPKNDNWITFYDKIHGMYRSVLLDSIIEFVDYKEYKKSCRKTKS